MSFFIESLENADGGTAHIESTPKGIMKRDKVIACCIPFTVYYYYLSTVVSHSISP